MCGGGGGGGHLGIYMSGNTCYAFPDWSQEMAEEALEVTSTSKSHEDHAMSDMVCLFVCTKERSVW